MDEKETVLGQRQEAGQGYRSTRFLQVMKKESKPHHTHTPKTNHSLMNFRFSPDDREMLENLSKTSGLSMTDLIKSWMKLERSRLDIIKDKIKEKREELEKLFKLENAERERLQHLELEILEEK